MEGNYSSGLPGSDLFSWTLYMPVVIRKLPGKQRWTVREAKKGGRVYAKSTTKPKAEAQKRLLDRVGNKK